MQVYMKGNVAQYFLWCALVQCTIFCHHLSDSIKSVRSQSCLRSPCKWYSKTQKCQNWRLMPLFSNSQQQHQKKSYVFSELTHLEKKNLCHVILLFGEVGQKKGMDLFWKCLEFCKCLRQPLSHKAWHTEHWLFTSFMNLLQQLAETFMFT